MSATAFWVYVDLSEGVARVHREDCRYVRSRTRTLSADNWWALAFATREQSHAAAARMLAGAPDSAVENCINCLGHGV